MLPAEKCGALRSCHQDGRHPDRRQPKRDAAKLEAAGVDLGFSYQFLDDVADVVAGVAEVGKEQGMDAGKLTAVDLFGVDGAKRKAREFQDRSLAQLEGFRS